MNYLSVCSGIEAATVAWHHLGWTPVAFSEIEPFPSAVLAHHYPNVPNYGDMTKFQEWPIEPGTVDLLVGGTPCQSFSVAGLRKGISDPRGGLMLTYLDIAQRLRPRWIVWENVPGVLSSGGGRDFGSFLGALGELGYGFAYRVLDAQWCRTHRHPRAVPQRRRRVFVVGCLGDWKRAAQVLFESESVCRDSAPRGKTRKASSSDAEAGAGAGCYWDGADVANTLTRKGCDDRMPDKDPVEQSVAFEIYGGNKRVDRPEGGFYVRQADTARTLDAAQGLNPTCSQGGTCITQQVPFTQAKRAQSTTDDETWVDGQVNPTQRCSAGRGADDQRTCVAFSSNMSEPDCETDGISPTVKVGSGLGIPSPPAVAVAFQQNMRDEVRLMNSDGQIAGALNAEAGMKQQNYIASQAAVAHAMIVRRLTPRECERLQGFPDDYTAIPWGGKPTEQCPDGPRYKALGNSMAVNCMAWIGERINGAFNA